MAPRAPAKPAAVLDKDQGVFEWKRRMGKHLAYHLNPINKIFHICLIPLQLFGIVKLLSFVQLYGAVDAGLGTVVLLSPIYVATEPLSGLVFCGGMMGLHAAAADQDLTYSGAWGLALGLVSFAVPFVVQTQVGHRVFEEQSRDDTELNIAEFKRTGNPIPLLLIFFYHVVEVLFWMGYRPATAAAVYRFRKAEVARFNN